MTRWRGRHGRGRRGLAAAAVALAALALTAAADPGEPEQVFEFADERIAESSGLAASQLHDGVYYTHNDSDDGAIVYAVDSSGATLAAITLQGVEARDWEAVAVGRDESGAPAVYVGDIGDNMTVSWPSVRVHRFTEPQALTDASVAPTSYEFVYEDGARDAEALLIDPADNRLYIVSKDISGGMYAAPETLSTDGPNTLTRVGSAPMFVTDGAFSPDGSAFALRTYWSVHFYAEPDRLLDSAAVPQQDIGESLTYTRDGAAVLVGAEGQGSAVWRVPVPAAALPEATAAPAPSADPSAAAPEETESEPAESEPPAEAAEPDGSGGPGTLGLIGTGAAVAAAAIAGIVVLARRG
ncbi:hypothetical protein [Allonocardiopsis opalescens]|uniref:WD40 repeat domain-containing protein n=1 Tax=Allonocardiopsis opalescens TaxID=1144618 RepID=A0A2T0Q9Y0_9ACTN|nr:hypothetical protein [Allonocardiopsis opalescens]PRY00645.1 hypothetical protein CLV72_102276 [Allonocardiopsis opalescens]